MKKSRDRFSIFNVAESREVSGEDAESGHIPEEAENAEISDLQAEVTEYTEEPGKVESGEISGENPESGQKPKEFKVFYGEPDEASDLQSEVTEHIEEHDRADNQANNLSILDGIKSGAVSIEDAESELANMLEKARTAETSDLQPEVTGHTEELDKTDNQANNLSILDRIKSGAVSIEDAESELANMLEKAKTAETSDLQPEVTEHTEELDKTEWDKVENGEISDENAEQGQILEEAETSDLQPEVTEHTEELKEAELDVIESEEIPGEDAEPEQAETPDVPSEVTEHIEEWRRTEILTKRERGLELAEKIQDWNPQIMRALSGSKEWPWPDKSWQWMWQNFSYPIYISHSIDVAEETELKIVLYEGDLFISGWGEPALKIEGAAFDVRTGQDENVIRLAGSTGQLHIWVPNNIKQVTAISEPGDIRLKNISADVDVHCQSGDLTCQRLKGNIKVRVNGGDLRLMGIEGAIDVDIIRGRSDVRDISSTDVSLKSTEGDIWLSLDSVSSGQFRCESTKGDINLLNNGELSCELLVEVTDGGQICPAMLPWQRLLGRSEHKLHGILMDGGASISLASHGGRIFIQEPWIM